MRKKSEEKAAVDLEKVYEGISEVASNACADSLIAMGVSVHPELSDDIKDFIYNRLNLKAE